MNNKFMKTLTCLALLVTLCSCFMGDQLIRFNGKLSEKYINSDCNILMFRDPDYSEKSYISSRTITEYEIDNNGKFKIGLVSPRRFIWVRLVCKDNGHDVILHQGPFDVVKDDAKYNFGKVGDAGR